MEGKAKNGATELADMNKERVGYFSILIFT